MNQKKAQAAIIGLLFAFMLIAVFATTQGILLDFVELGVNETQSRNATHGNMIVTIIQALPVFLVLMILVAVVALISGRTS